MKRKLLIFLGIITIFTAAVGVGEKAHATCDRSFLGFNAWWNGLDAYMNNDTDCELVGDEKIGDNLPSFTWTIVLNILHDLFAAVGYISIALITFGGYMYITSGGDPGKSVKARKTLTSAIVGLLIVLLANVIVDTIIGILNTGSSCTVTSGLLSGVELPNCDKNDLDAGNGHALANIFSSALSAGAIMAVGFIVYGGISYITSNGSPDKARKALRTLIFAAVGLVIVVAAALITNFVMSSASEAVKNAIIITTWKG